MKRNTAVYGVGIGINGREAAIQATQQALDQLGATRPVLALVFVAQEFNAAEVLAGLTALLGETPLWGFTTTRPLVGEGERARSVVVALLTGAELKAQVEWFPNYAQDSQSAARQFARSLKEAVFLPQAVVLAADGINGSLSPVCAALTDLPVRVSGCMAAGDVSQGKTFGIGKNQSGPGALSAAVLGGRFCLGVGLAHGWKDLGVYFRATRSRDVWLHALDEVPAAEVYARYFGYPAREWAFPPLSGMARLYPLAVEPLPTGTGPLGAPAAAGKPGDRLIRSALRVEVDGSLRMSAPVPQGAVVHLMTGDPEACLEAARAAAREALEDLAAAGCPGEENDGGEPPRPLLAVALVDAAYQMLFESRPDQLSAALKSVLGDIPLVGAYTYGQVARPALDRPPLLHNQNIAVLVFGER